MAISAPGIGSNLDVNSIVSQLMALEAQPLKALNKKEASYLSKISALGSLQGALSSFQSALGALSNPSKFKTVTATSSDSTIATSSASSTAVAGSYAVDVTKLAQAQTIATAGRASTTATIGDGGKTTLTFQFGTISGGKLDNGRYVTDNTDPMNPKPSVFTQDANQSSGTVVIDNTNNSLQGIRDAINKAGFGVTATIVSDGSATPNHLVITSNKTGETSSMKIDVKRDPLLPADPSTSTISDLLSYDPTGGATAQKLTQSSAAQNTALTVNGIAISGTSKTISEAIQGVTLNVSKIGATSVTVARDTASVQSSIGAFVKAYNEFDKTYKSLTGYDPATKTGGPLLGDSSVRNVQTQIRSMLGSNLNESDSTLKTLSQIGISFQKDGSMSLNSTKLQTAISNNFDDLAGMFASIGTTSDSLVKFVSSSSATKPSNGTLNLSAIATQGKISGTVAADTTISSGDSLGLTIDGVSASLALTQGSYTPSSLAAYLQSSINGLPAYSSVGTAVVVSADANGILSITSNKYGSASKVAVSGNAKDKLFQLPVTEDGIDVAGTINGVAATGSGRFLTGATGSSVDGLKLEIVGGSSGARGTVVFTQGYAEMLSKQLENFIGTKGSIRGKTDGLNKSISEIAKSRDTLNLKLAATEKRLRAQFSTLDATIGRMNSTSNYLTQQLASLNKLSF